VYDLSGIDLGKTRDLDLGRRNAAEARQRLPRKEVIQPHLPVRLPCYDFVPIAGSALDGSLPCGLGHRLQAYPTFMT
jgi:hypothetical protein